MKIFTKILGLLLVVLAALAVDRVQAQSVLDPTDSVYTYNPSAPPAQPAWGTIGKWVRTVRLNWANNGTNAYKAYFYKGNAFRLKFPKTYDPAANDGKKYPMLVFFHGRGEGASTVYDNEYQLYHGGNDFRLAVENGKFDGYILCMQNIGGYFGASHYAAIKEIIDYMVINNKLDPFRVTDNGLSAGAQGTWEMLLNYPTYIAGCLPMSGVYAGYTDASVVNKVKYTPVWNFHGGLDPSPSPYTAYQVRDAMLAAGGNYKNKMYPNFGHGVWGEVWKEADFYPFLNRAYMSNPWTLFGRTEFCAGDPINVTLGLVAGLDQYEWRKDGVLLPNTGNTIQVTQLGTYDARVRRGSVWSEWSRIPVVIKIKDPTVVPNITVTGLMSKVIPAPDGNTGVTLSIPEGFTSYEWQKVGNSTVLGTANSLNATSPGDYIVKVTELYGCAPGSSAPFKVVDANGANKPDAATGLLVSTVSKTSLKLNWSDNPTPQYDETNFEVYQASQAGGPYKLIGITAANVLTFTTASNLSAKTTYYYKVRAVNENGAAAPTAEASGTTDADVTGPRAPGNLAVTNSSRSSVSLSWTASTDDVGLYKYDVYVNGQKTYTTKATTFTVHGLEPLQNYKFTVKAIDLSNNESPFSNQVTGGTITTGLNYKYYEGTGWNEIPNFNNRTPVETGVVSSFSTSPRNRNDNFGMLFEGYIRITVAGSYTFRTNSDDGSKLYIGGLNQTGSPYSHNGTPLVDNDGVHGTQNREGTINLSVGIYPIAVSYFDGTGGDALTVTYKTPTSGTNYINFPTNTLLADFPITTGASPAAPSNVVATGVTYKRIDLTWTDNSNNETGFEIYRSTSISSNYFTIGTTGPNTTSFIDSSAPSPNTVYFYRVKAIGEHGESGFDVPATTLRYRYYENNGTPWTVLPVFHTLTPVTSGLVSNFTLTGTQQRGDNFGLIFEGAINITTQGSYTFYTNSDEGTRLLINGSLVVNNDNIHVATEKSGQVTLSPGLHRIQLLYFERTGAEALTVSYKLGDNGTQEAIPNANLVNMPWAATLPLPVIPTSPNNFVATGISKSAVQINWNDRSNNETGFEIFRSSNNNANYVQIATLDSNTTSYVDTGLFANSVQYYKVRAAGIGGKSADSNADSAKTFNGVPEIVTINSRSARYGVATVIAVSASDADGDALSFSAQNLPAFATLTDNGDKTATLTLNPDAAQQGVYNNVTILANDTHGASASTSFNLTINDNFDPVIADIANASVSESGSAVINLSATDQNAGDQLTWSVSNLPDNYTLTPGANGAATLTLNPTYAAAGTYTVSVTAADNNGGSTVKTFSLTVNNVDPQDKKVYIRFKHQTDAPAPWNSITSLTTNNLKDGNGATTSFGLQFVDQWWITWNEGPNGGGTAIYPDAVLKEYYFFGQYPGIFTGPNTVTANLTGLDANKKYDVTFYAGSAWSMLANNGTTTFTVGATTQSLDVQNNTQNTVTFNSLTPAADGTVTFTVGRASGTQVGYLGAIVIREIFDDGTAPVAPKTLTATFTNGKVQLNWQDAAYNETGYEVYRSLTEGGTYAKIGDLNSNATGFLDGTVNGNTQYFYKVQAINNYGASPFGNTAAITTQNRIPAITAIANVALKSNETTTVNVTTQDDASDVITLTVTGLPSFASFTDNGNGTGTININPNGTIGSFTDITITAKDAANATVTESFDIAVVDKDVQSVYVNFTDGANIAPKPWNNFSNWPGAGFSLTNLKDDSDVPTGIDVITVSGFEGNAAAGMRPGNGKTLYPESVLRGGFVEGTTNAKTIRVTGLSTSKRYNFVFFNSHDDGFKGLTNFTINGTTVSLDATYNIDKTVQINGITPSANGEVNISVQKAANQNYAFINAMIIQIYEPTTTLLSPIELRVTKTTTSSVSLQWQDRAFDETGYQIWRATSANGSYSLLTTVAANTQSYTNSNLSANSTYYYTVRAVKAGSQSGYSNTVGTTTYGQAVFVNYANTLTAPLPWFDTQTNPQQDYVWNGMHDETGKTTNMGMMITQNFAGLYSAGVQTGNNSGVYPDNVMFDSYGLFPGETGKLKITGLNLSQKYNFTFFASANIWGDVNTSYEANGKTVLLNASFNSTGTVTMYDLQADENGEIEITVKPGTSGSQFGLLGALVIQGFNQPADGSIPSTPGNEQLVVLNGNGKKAVAASQADEAITATNSNEGIFNAYPNPFKQSFTLSVPSAIANDDVEVALFDVAGRVVYRKQFGGLKQGTNLLKIETGANMTKGGVYVVRVAYRSGAESKFLKLQRN